MPGIKKRICDNDRKSIIYKMYVSSSYSNNTGYTINNYITRLRIERAKDLLKTTSLPANKICIMLGIEDTNYFYRLFKKQTGKSPNEFR